MENWKIWQTAGEVGGIDAIHHKEPISFIQSIHYEND